MKFKHSAFIENTPEMREWLEMLGYKKWMWDNEDNDTPFISPMPDSKKYAVFTQYEVAGFASDIDCRSNPDLFKAVTAIREDSDMWQLFTDGVKWTLCYEESILMWRDIYNFPDKNLIHKATLTELKEHFNKGK